MARNPEGLFSPPQSSLNLLPPTSSAQSVAEVNHAVTSAGQNACNGKLQMNGECRNHLSIASSGDKFHPAFFQTPSFIPPLAWFWFCLPSPQMTRFTALRKDDYRKLT